MTEAAISEDRADQVPLLYAFAIEAGQIPSPNLQTIALVPTSPAGSVTRPSTVATMPQLPTAPFPTQSLRDQQIALAGVRDWKAVTLVGEGYIDKQCDAFISALNDLERSKRTTLADLNAVQSATVGIMGLAIAAQKTIGIVGIAFGLAVSLFDTTTSTVLYQLPASAIATIVEAQRQYLRATEAASLSSVTNQGLAAARLNEYVRYCAPVTIEANITKVLNNTKGTSEGIATNVTQPVVVPALVHTSAFKASLLTRMGLKQQIHALDASQLVMLAARMEPNLTRASATVQDAVRALDPRSARLTDPVMAKRILSIWVVTENDPMPLTTWADAIRAIQGS